MDIEEAKRIIQDKIKADESAREIRSQIKTYIHQKQDAREGFTETFKPLIETSEKVKESVDTQQNKLIKQLQENQLALTQGFEGNRLALNSALDKMDIVNKWELSQLPGYEAIEEPEKEAEKDEDEDEDEDEDQVIYKITLNDFKILQGGEPDYKNPKGKDLLSFSSKFLRNIIDKEIYDKSKYILRADHENKILKVFKIQPNKEESQEEIATIPSSEFNKGLNYAKAVKFLEENELPLPESIIGKNLEKIIKYQKRSGRLVDDYKRILENKAKFKTIDGKNTAKAKNKNPRKDTGQQIEYYNILGQYYQNISDLVVYKSILEKKGSGIIHFNNPQQLVSRLELLAGSIIAGNNGVKQEFSQIAHLLHQLKIITKKTLNDLLKKYILLK